MTESPEKIINQIRNWNETYSDNDKVADLAKYLKNAYPSIEYEVNRGNVTLGALIGTIGIEMKTNADSFLLYELKRDIPGYLCVSSSVIVIVSNPMEGIVEGFKSFLREKGLLDDVWIVEI
jgi:hypothetical protein